MNHSISKYIDHTLLKPDSTKAQIKKLCDEALQYGFYSVCVNSGWIPFCKDFLEQSDVKICSVVGFPLGACLTSVKEYETKMAIEAGADEIDMVLNIGLLKTKLLELVISDISGVVKAAGGKTVKVIIETGLLSPDEKIEACIASVEAKAHFVKTSTGFSGGGASVEDILLMKKTINGKAKIKASGGIKDLKQAQALIDAGADRLGTSSGVEIINGLVANKGY